MADRYEDYLIQKQPGFLLFGGARMALLDIESGFWGIRRQIEPLLGSVMTNSVLQQAGVNGGASFASSFTPSIDQSGGEAFRACLQVYQAAGFGQFEITSLEWPIGKISIQADQTFESWMMAQHNHDPSDPCCAYTAGVLVGFINIISGRQDVVCVERTCQGRGDQFCQFDLLLAEEVKDQQVVAFSHDPGLGRQLNLLELLFERMPMGIAVLDPQFRIQRYNPTWEDFSNRYYSAEAEKLVPGVRFFDHLPGNAEALMPLFERVLTGETIRQNQLGLIAGGDLTYWDVVLAPLYENENVNGILCVAVDATERVKFHQNLEQTVDERTRELRTLLQLTQDINAILELENLLDSILDQLKTVVDYTGASIMTLEDDDLVMQVYRGPIPQEQARTLRFPVESAMANHEVIREQKPLIIPDVRGNSVPAKMFQQTASDELESTFGYIRSWLGVPLMAKGRLLGMLTLDHEQPNYFSAQHAELVQAFANQAAIAIVNAQLYQETQRRAEESEALFSVQQAITSRLDASEVLQMIADEGRRLTKADISAVYILEGEELEISYVSGDVPESIVGYRLRVDESIAGKVIQTREAIQVPDTWANSTVDRAASDQVQARSLLIVPLISGTEPVGTITVANRTPGEFNQEDRQLLTKLAANVVISLENARLYQAEHDRRRVAESMREIVTVLNSSQSLEETLDYIVERAGKLLDAEACLIHMIDYEAGFVSIEASCGLPDDLLKIAGFPLYSALEADVNILDEKPYWVSDLHKHPPIDSAQEDLDPDSKTWRALTYDLYRSWIAVPIVIGEEVFGSLAFYFNEPYDFDEESVKLAAVFADQAALAIENTRLQDAAEEAAISRERNRLARDLHDAVTQTLFSASMIADVLPTIWNRDEAEGKRRLEELRLLTRGALSEMRTLLIELRPTALSDTNLIDLIGHQINAFKARTRLPVRFEHCCEPDPGVEVKEVFYRIAQEALNNIAKHADASEVDILLEVSPAGAQLTIQDDGVGFDLETARMEGFGMNIMAERAQHIGAEFKIESQVQKGTKLQLSWTAPQESEDKDG